MSEEQDFALKASTEAPWWAKAPIWLSLGIIGVPSLIAIGAGYFLASNVTTRLTQLEQLSRTEISHLENQNTDADRRWELVINVMRLTLESQIKTCLHEAKDAKEQQECVTMADHNKVLERLKQPPQK